MGRYKLKDGEKKKHIGIMIQEKIITKIGAVTCKEIAEEAINKVYNSVK